MFSVLIPYCTGNLDFYEYYPAIQAYGYPFISTLYNLDTRKSTLTNFFL